MCTMPFPLIRRKVLWKTGYVKDKDRMAQLLREQMKDNGVKEKEVVFSIASSKIASREVTVPYVRRRT